GRALIVDDFGDDAIAEPAVDREHRRVLLVVRGVDARDAVLRRPANRGQLDGAREAAAAEIRTRAGHLVRRQPSLAIDDQPGKGGRASVELDDEAAMRIERRIAE